MRQTISRVKPLKSLEDFAGFKIRVLTSKIVIDLFTTLGASPTPLPGGGPEFYTALQTGLVDGEDFPLATLETSKHYEIAKYVALTNHLWVGYRLLGNGDAMAALPADVRTVVVRNNKKYAALERQDMATFDESLKQTIAGQGMVFNSVDTRPFRAKLAPYYARWRPQFGEVAWTLLEKSVGKLG